MVQTAGHTESGLVNPFAEPPINNSLISSAEYDVFMNWIVSTHLTLKYAAKRERSEKVTFTAIADFQEIITEISDSADRETVSISGSDVGLPIDGVVPIGDVSRYSYFPTDRGQWSIEYLLCLARAKLLAKCRVVSVEFETLFERGIELACNKNASLTDERLPGGTVVGKIVEYGLTGNGDRGEFVGKARLGCAIGYGNAAATVDGTPSYVAIGYVARGYQHIDGEIVVLPAGDIGYSVPADIQCDDGVTFPLTRAGAIISEYKTAATYSLTLRNLENGPFNNLYALTTTPLTAPKQIDLEAASNG
jgi:hypothetical protein